MPDAPPPPPEPDFTLDRDGRVVFTRAYHLRRGTCCGNRCRYCPFGWANVHKPSMDHAQQERTDSGRRG